MSPTNEDRGNTNTRINPGTAQTNTNAQPATPGRDQKLLELAQGLSQSFDTISGELKNILQVLEENLSEQRRQEVESTIQTTLDSLNAARSRVEGIEEFRESIDKIEDLFSAGIKRELQDFREQSQASQAALTKELATSRQQGKRQSFFGVGATFLTALIGIGASIYVAFYSSSFARSEIEQASIEQAPIPQYT